MFYNRERKRAAVSLVKAPFQEAAHVNWDFVHHKSVERMVAKMLTYVCKGKDCDISRELH